MPNIREFLLYWIKIDFRSLNRKKNKLNPSLFPSLPGSCARTRRFTASWPWSSTSRCASGTLRWRTWTRCGGGSRTPTRSCSSSTCARSTGTSSWSSTSAASGSTCCATRSKPSRKLSYDGIGKCFFSPTNRRGGQVEIIQTKTNGQFKCKLV